MRHPNGVSCASPTSSRCRCYSSRLICCSRNIDGDGRLTSRVKMVSVLNERMTAQGASRRIPTTPTILPESPSIRCPTVLTWNS